MIASLVKSMSTLVYFAVVEMVGHELNRVAGEASGSGEILTCYLQKSYPEDEIQWFDHDCRNEAKVFVLLHRYRRGFVVKDPGQPYMVARYSLMYPEAYSYLCLQRQVEDVVCAMALQIDNGNWHYASPVLALGLKPEALAYLIGQGLMSRDSMLKLFIQAVRRCHSWQECYRWKIDADEVIEEPGVLTEKLHQMGYDPKPTKLFERPDIVEKRQEVLARRKTLLWQRIQELAA